MNQENAREPKYNFITSSGRRRSNPHRLIKPKKSDVKAICSLKNVLQDGTAILSCTIDNWASKLESSECSLLDKRKKLQMALDSHCSGVPEIGGFPSSICISMCVEALKQFIAVVPKTNPLRQVLDQGIQRCVYPAYHSVDDRYENVPYSQIGTMSIYSRISSCIAMRAQEDLSAYQEQVLRDAPGCFRKHLDSVIDQTCRMKSVVDLLSNSEEKVELLGRVFESLASDEVDEKEVRIDCLLNVLRIGERKKLLKRLVDNLRQEDEEFLMEVIDDVSEDYDIQSLGQENQNSFFSSALLATSKSSGITRRASRSIRQSTCFRKTTLLPSSSSNSEACQPIGEQDVAINGVLRKELTKIVRNLHQFRENSDIVSSSIESIESLLNASKVEYNDSGSESEESNDSDDEASTIIQSITSHLRDEPQMFTYVVKSMPNLMLKSIRENPGILKFCIAKNANIVQDFLQLKDEHMQILSKAMECNPGLRLLWGSIPGVAFDATKDFASTLCEFVEWLNAHSSQIFEIFKSHPDISSKLFGVVTNALPGESYACEKLFRLPAFDTLRAMERITGFEDAISKNRSVVCTMLNSLCVPGRKAMVEHLVNSPNVTLAVQAMNPATLQKLVAQDVAGWKSFVVNILTADENFLRDVLLFKTKTLKQQDQFMEIVDAALHDRSISHLLNSRAVLDRRMSIGIKHMNNSAAQRSRSVHGYKSHKPKLSQQSMLSQVSESSDESTNNLDAKHMTKIPSTWKGFLHIRATGDEKLTRIEDKDRLVLVILDLLVENLKENLSLSEPIAIESSISSSICDHLMQKHGDGIVVGEILQDLLHGCEAYHDDIVVSMFCAACEMTAITDWTMVTHFFRTLCHMLQIDSDFFKSNGCVVQATNVVKVVHAMFTDHISPEEITFIVERICICARRLSESQRRGKSNSILRVTKEYLNIGMQEAFEIIMDAWKNYEKGLDQEFIDAFRQHSVGGSVGIDQFTSVIESVLRDTVSRRDARFAFYEIGQDYIEQSTLLEATTTFNFRSQILPSLETIFTDIDLERIQRSMGMSSVFSQGVEIELLKSTWKRIEPKVNKQLHSKHQTTKMKHKLETGLQEVSHALKSLASISNTSAESTRVAWHLMQDLTTNLRLAMATHAHFSRIFVQVQLCIWIRKIRRRKALEKRNIYAPLPLVQH